MSRSLRTDPYPRRAARRAGRGVPIRVTRPRPGFTHPAGPADIVRVLTVCGPESWYGIRAIELRQRPPGEAAGQVPGRLRLASLRLPGVVLLFEQPPPPWHLPGALTPGDAARLERAGARITAGDLATRVDWPGDTLRDLMLFDGLLHEIGHHRVQHAARRPHTAAMRTGDHERRADTYAHRARAAATRADDHEHAANAHADHARAAATRTDDHERRADAHAGRARAAWAGAGC